MYLWNVTEISRNFDQDTLNQVKTFTERFGSRQISVRIVFNRLKKIGFSLD